MDEFPFAFIVNWDHTGIHYVPVALWTMKKGQQELRLLGWMINDR